MVDARLAATARCSAMIRHSAVALHAVMLVLAASIWMGAPPSSAQEAKDVLTAGETDTDASEAPVTARSGAGGPRHDIVKGTGPDAVVAPIRPTAPVVAAKTLFGAHKTAAPLAARAIGFYSRGCLAGAVALPVNGPHWQTMRLSRNRNWGHPELVRLISTFATEAKADGWPGLLVGDMSQPRGGPMLTGHNSHQIGLDADIWLTPMPQRELTRQEREDMSAVSMLTANQLAVDPKVWTGEHVKIIKRAASYADVERILVHPAIKKALCEASAADLDKKWLHKVRPVWGHFYHFHVRLKCPKDMSGCQPQPQPAADDGCGKELDDWYKRLTAPPKPIDPNAPKPVPVPPLTLEALPADCRAVLAAGPADTPPAAKPADKNAAAKTNAR